MYFKPRIFISSSLRLNIVRTSIKDLLESNGAEVILYEKDLVPSINAATYRQDILESDFVIFIFDKFYGNKTNTGMSGTHEEWKIALDSRIPKHVYILKNLSKNQDRELKKFINENINSNYISYYFYTDENDLLNRIRATTFTIAKDIVLSNIKNMKIDDKVICKLSYERDYKKAIDIIKLFDDIIESHNWGIADITQTNIILTFSDMFNYPVDILSSYFINDTYNNFFIDFLVKVKELSSFIANNSMPGNSRRIHLKRSKMTIDYHYNKFTHPFTEYDKLNSLQNEIHEKYLKFREYTIKRKGSSDINL